MRVLLTLLLLTGCASRKSEPAIDATRTVEPEAVEDGLDEAPTAGFAGEEEHALDDEAAGPADAVAEEAEEPEAAVTEQEAPPTEVIGGVVSRNEIAEGRAPAAAPEPEPSYDEDAVADMGEAVEETKARPGKRKKEEDRRPRFDGSTGSSTSTRRASKVDGDVLEKARDAYRSGQGAIDLDGDGTPDWYVGAAAADGLPRTEALDIDGDGQMDITTRLEGEARETRQDVDHDGRPEQITTVSALPEGGSLREDLYDTDGDGDLDLRVQTRLDVAEGFSQRIEWVDSDGDGRWELVGATRLPLDQPSLARVQRSGTEACTDGQKKRIDRAIDQAIARGHQGLSSTNPALAMRFLRRLVVADVEVRCGWDTEKLAACAVSPGASMASAWTGPGPVDIRLSGLVFDAAAGCDPLDATLFHEVLHYVVGIHPAQDGRSDPGDTIYACQESCFGVSTAQSCAACRGTRVGDPACSAYPDLGCDGAAVPGLCVETGSLYASTGQCTDQCGGTCLSRGPCRP